MSSIDTPKETEQKLVSILAGTAEMQKRYNQQLRDLITYGISAPYIYKKPTLWQRIKGPVRDFMYRCRDAWWVLTGKATITWADDE